MPRRSSKARSPLPNMPARSSPSDTENLLYGAGRDGMQSVSIDRMDRAGKIHAPPRDSWQLL